MRWRLMSAHYLRTAVPTEWEYKETDRTSGKQGRKVYEVPALMNPQDPADHNYPGEIIVCHAGKGQGKDIEIVGDPSPEMEPLDDEARALSDSLRHTWIHPIDSLPGNGGLYTDTLLMDLQKQVAALTTGSPLPRSQSVDQKEFADLKAMVAQLAAQNAELMAKLDNKAARR